MLSSMDSSMGKNGIGLRVIRMVTRHSTITTDEPINIIISDSRKELILQYRFTEESWLKLKEVKEMAGRTDVRLTTQFHWMVRGSGTTNSCDNCLRSRLYRFFWGCLFYRPQPPMCSNHKGEEPE